MLASTDAEHFVGYELSVAMTDPTARTLGAHLDKGPRQEDLTFFIWRPSRGATRCSAIVTDVILPSTDERVLQGNVAFTGEYLRRVLAHVPTGSGVGLAHSHLGPGWQGMSHDDVVAERDRLAGAIAGQTGMPVLGLTRGTDGAWSARAWLRTGPNRYARLDATTVRVVGTQLAITYHPQHRPAPTPQPTQTATISVWGHRAQADLVRTRVGIVGLGSVGSIVAEALARLGVEQIVYIDHDRIELRNLDRTVGALETDVGTYKVDVAARLGNQASTAPQFTPRAVPRSVLTSDGLAAALDCDALVCCVDRPLPRFVLNILANAHLIPMIDGGILARVTDAGEPLHVDWRIHTVGPNRACLHCLGALLRSDVALDRDGLLDDPDYIASLSPADRDRYARRNVFAFSLAVAAHEVLQLVGLISGMPRISGTGPQHYQAYPGSMSVEPTRECAPRCDVGAFTATATELTPHLET